MDVRVFPFSFPPIKGGAQGGDSPTPTPPPVVTYYDVSEATLDVSFHVEDGKWKRCIASDVAAATIKVNGIVSLDTSNVAQLEIISGFSSITADDVEMKEDTDFISVVKTDSLTGAAVAISELGNFYRAGMTFANWNSKMYDKTAGGQAFVTMTAYDNNGNVLQTQTWTALVT